MDLLTEARKPKPFRSGPAKFTEEEFWRAITTNLLHQQCKSWPIKTKAAIWRSKPEIPQQMVNTNLKQETLLKISTFPRVNLSVRTSTSSPLDQEIILYLGDSKYPLTRETEAFYGGMENTNKRSRDPVYSGKDTKYPS